MVTARSRAKWPVAAREGRQTPQIPVASPLRTHLIRTPVTACAGVLSRVPSPPRKVVDRKRQNAEPMRSRAQWLAVRSRQQRSAPMLAVKPVGQSRGEDGLGRTGRQNPMGRPINGSHSEPGGTARTLSVRGEIEPRERGKWQESDVETGPRGEFRDVDGSRFFPRGCVTPLSRWQEHYLPTMARFLRQICASQSYCPKFGEAICHSQSNPRAIRWWMSPFRQTSHVTPPSQ